jgi:putative SOS response-associated peptidase YedK
MCGRYSISIILKLLEQQTGKAAPEQYKPSYNVAPSQPVVVDNGETLEMMKWGYQPVWAKKGVINAQLEGVAEKPFWKQGKRCAVLADGFYEWKTTTSGKVPYRITPDELFAFAGVFDEKTRTVAIVTTTPNSVVKPIHNRMPLMMELKDAKAWIEKSAHKEIPAKKLRAYKVSTAINNPRNNSKELLAEA